VWYLVSSFRTIHFEENKSIKTKMTLRNGLLSSVEDEEVEAVESNDVHNQGQQFISALRLNDRFGILGRFRFHHRLHPFLLF
jgi:hypothetical protein